MSTLAHAIHFTRAGDFLIARLTVHGLPAGIAKVRVKSNAAELMDIVIYKQLIFPKIWKLLYFWVPLRRGLRGRGYGTIFLKAICSRLEQEGTKRLVGRMSGDKDRLARWYGRQGFRVNRETGDLVLEMG